jgi:ATP-dependent DNA helicase RecQ
VLRQLLSAKLIAHDPSDRDRLFVTEDGQRVLRGQAPFMLREDVVSKKPRGRNKAPALPGDADAAVLAALKALRSDLAHRQRQPAYVIFPDRTLIEMAARRPQNLDELAAVHGVGIAKLQKYGAAFLAVIRAEADA